MWSIVEDLEYKRRLKEVLHIYNVSLKNNKGLETIKNFIKAVLDYYDYVIYYYLEKEKEKGNINEIPNTPIKRYELFLSIIDDKLKDYFKYYKTLRVCLNSEIMIQNEFRRSMIIKCKGIDREIILTIKDIKEIFESIKNFSEYIEKN
ncbi:MAG: hypothetical protein ACP5G1_02815 [Nanopusillaceae archaeon]